MRKLLFALLLFPLFAMAQEPDPGIYPPWYRLKRYINNGSMTLTYKTFGDDITLQNGEKISNSTDALGRFVFDDDAATLGTFSITSSNAAANLSNNDKLLLTFRAYDDSSGWADYATIEGIATDVSDESEDGRINFKVMIAGTNTQAGYIVGDDWYLTDNLEVNGDVTMENDEVFANSSDGVVSITGDDDAATLLTVYLASSNAQANMANSDHVDLMFRANDNAGSAVNWVQIVSTITDVATASKDSKVEFKTYDTNSAVTPLTLTGDDATFADNVEINGNITLENDEVWQNNVDGQVWLKYDDDAAGLGIFALNSSNAQANMSDNDYFEIQAIANDDSGGTTDFADIQFRFSDVSDESEDGQIQFWAMTAGSNAVMAKLDGGTFDLCTPTLTMANDEILGNAVDAIVTCTFNDDAATLGAFSIGSSNAQGNMADNDLFYFNWFANDESGNSVNWVQQVMTITDATANSKDSKWELKTWDTNSSVTPISATGNDVTFADNVTVTGIAETEAMIIEADGLTIGSNAFANGDVADTVAVAGATTGDLYFFSWTADPGDPKDERIVATATGFIVTCGAAVTGTPTYNWMRRQKD